MAPASRSRPPERKNTGEPDAPAQRPPASVTTGPERSTMMMSRPGPTPSLRTPSTSTFRVDSERPRVTERAVPFIPVVTWLRGRMLGHSSVSAHDEALVAGPAPHAATAIAKATRPANARVPRDTVISSLSLRCRRIPADAKLLEHSAWPFPTRFQELPENSWPKGWDRKAWELLLECRG